LLQTEDLQHSIFQQCFAQIHTTFALAESNALKELDTVQAFPVLHFSFSAPERNSLHAALIAEQCWVFHHMDKTRLKETGANGVQLKRKWIVF